MSYNSIAQMQEDYDLRKRLYACAGQEKADNPQQWTDQNIWQIVANDEFDQAYHYAVGTGNVNPGGDEAVISDAMILAHVQPMLPVKSAEGS